MPHLHGRRKQYKRLLRIKGWLFFDFGNYGRNILVENDHYMLKLFFNKICPLVLLLSWGLHVFHDETVVIMLGGRWFGSHLHSRCR